MRYLALQNESWHFTSSVFACAFIDSVHCSCFQLGKEKRFLERGGRFNAEICGLLVSPTETTALTRLRICKACGECFGRKDNRCSSVDRHLDCHTHTYTHPTASPSWKPSTCSIC
ncbi:hypothetical protein B0T26DRAFT_439344 [Lasiosphaeria miniovina]|uniref:Uncharacterized protein n=1 Tax=Lasiosphaeria miniovina TaxID=1954250 RepID=A0AA39ZYI1_9PEZI|nr:uncharacterized protein B0T26DRAFT_439344 [Lasiosphaeria miniovina]KAK0705945.1 hypothetical protein B0T26DRAFT_439344 [Lasiosphaeria miniovina]